jgi:hypothetical protein
MSRRRWLAVAAAVGLAGCKVECNVEAGPSMIMHDKMVAMVRALANDIGDVTSVSCPPLMSMQNASVSCVLQFAEGPERKIKVVVTDATTGYIEAKYEGLLNRTKVVEWLTKELAGAQLFAKTVVCPGNQEATAGTTFVCQAELTAGPTIDVSLRMKPGYVLAWEYTAAMFEVDSVEPAALEKARRQDPTVQTVNCGDGKTPAGTLKCTAAGPGGDFTVEVPIGGD